MVEIQYVYLNNNNQEGDGVDKEEKEVTKQEKEDTGDSGSGTRPTRQQQQKHSSCFPYNDWNALGDVEAVIVHDDDTNTHRTPPPEAWPNWKIVRRIHYVVDLQATKSKEDNPQAAVAYYDVQQFDPVQEYIKWKKLMAPRTSKQTSKQQKVGEEEEDVDMEEEVEDEESLEADDEDYAATATTIMTRHHRRSAPPQRYQPTPSSSSSRKRIRLGGNNSKTGRRPNYADYQEEDDSSDDESDLIPYAGGTTRKQASTDHPVVLVPPPPSSSFTNLDLGQVTLHADPLSPNLYALHFLPSPNPLGVSIYYPRHQKGNKKQEGQGGSVCLHAIQWRRLEINGQLPPPQRGDKLQSIDGIPIAVYTPETLETLLLRTPNPQSARTLILERCNDNNSGVATNTTTNTSATTTAPTNLPITAKALGHNSNHHHNKATTNDGSMEDYQYYELCIPIMVHPTTGQPMLGIKVGPVNNPTKRSSTNEDSGTSISSATISSPSQPQQHHHFSTQFQALVQRSLSTDSNVTPQYGDVVTQVNRQSTFGLSHEKVVSLFKQATTSAVSLPQKKKNNSKNTAAGAAAEVRIILRPPVTTTRSIPTNATQGPVDDASVADTIPTTTPPKSPIIKEFDVIVTLTDRGLGMVLSHVGGKAVFERLHPFAMVEYPQQEHPIQLQEGDAVIAIDQVSVQDKTYAEIIDILKQPPPPSSPSPTTTTTHVVRQRHICFQRNQ
jgi:hypothetical protein